MYDVVVKKFTFAVSSRDELLVGSVKETKFCEHCRLLCATNIDEIAANAEDSPLLAAKTPTEKDKEVKRLQSLRSLSFLCENKTSAIELNI